MFRHIIEQPENVDDINHNFRVLFDILGGQIDGPHISEKAISEVHLADDLLIPGHNVYVNQDTEFSAEYDPTEKVAIDDVGNLAYSDLVEKAMLGETIIDGGFIKTNMIHIDGSSLFGDGYDPTEKVTYDEAGELAYSDLVEKAMLGDTIIVGGYIKTDMISVGSDSSFEVGYDPSVKLDSSDVGDLAYEDLVEEAMLGSTIISGGWIKTELLTADNIRTGTLSSVYINVSTDVVVGRNLQLQTTDVGDGIEFRSGSTLYGSIKVGSTTPRKMQVWGNQGTVLGSSGSATEIIGSGDISIGNDVWINGDIRNVGTVTASHVSTDTISIGSGWSGSFTNGDGATVQVSNGIITSVS